MRPRNPTRKRIERSTLRPNTASRARYSTACGSSIGLARSAQAPEAGRFGSPHVGYRARTHSPRGGIRRRNGPHSRPLAQDSTELRTVGTASAKAHPDPEFERPIEFPATPELQPDYYTNEMTMNGISEVVGENESRVSQIPKIALKQMAAALQSEGIHSAEAFERVCITAQCHFRAARTDRLSSYPCPSLRANKAA